MRTSLFPPSLPLSLNCAQRIVGLLREAGKLIHDASRAEKTEDRRKFILHARTYTQTVRELRTAMHGLIERIPRGDFPKKNEALLDRYRQFLGEE